MNSIQKKSKKISKAFCSSCDIDYMYYDFIALKCEAFVDWYVGPKIQSYAKF